MVLMFLIWLGVAACFEAHDLIAGNSDSASTAANAVWPVTIAGVAVSMFAVGVKKAWRAVR